MDSIKPFVQEFKEYRKLTPIRVIMTGAPYSGKTYYAKKLAEHYEIHYLNVEEIVKKAFTTIVGGTHVAPCVLAHN